MKTNIKSNVIAIAIAIVLSGQIFASSVFTTRIINSNSRQFGGDNDNYSGGNGGDANGYISYEDNLINGKIIRIW